jgi:putative DNA primase/helicase
VNVVIKLPNTETPQEQEALPPECSDEALALRFAKQHANDARYVAQWDAWFLWDGRRWVKDDTLKAIDHTREVCRAAAAEYGNMPIASRIASKGTIFGVERLARSDRRLAATVNQWDVTPLLLNTPDGTVDLRTGKLGEHRQQDCSTKMTAVSPGGTCPQWVEFLKRIFGGDAALIDYVQRVAGYALTGVTSEHALFFCYGTGANGKSTLLNTLTGIMGDYAAVATMETFTATNIDRHPTDLAMLRGARTVTAQETEEGRRWAEAKIKSVTGGDPITARFMRQDNFTFIPQFKLVIGGNHKPGLRGVDEAIRRRIHLIPFAVTIPEGERDPSLFDKLKAEWPGILAWAIEGCLKWQSGGGLKPPAAVVDATAKYLEAEDTLNLWLEECCEKNPNAWQRSSELFDSWKAYAERCGEPSGSRTRFVQMLEAKGFPSNRTNKGRGIPGLRLRHDKLNDPSTMTLVTPNPVISKKMVNTG